MHTLRGTVSQYADEAAVDPQLAYDALVADYGLTCGNRAAAAAVVAAARRTSDDSKHGRSRTAPLYLLYNAWPRSQWAPNGAARWPSHGLDLEEVGWTWSFEPDAKDLAAAALLHALIADFAAYNGTMPPAWGWPPVTPATSPAFPTLVVALPESAWPWPGGGVRVEMGWHAAECDALNASGIGEQYW